ncbi:hypothetical protein ACP70R_026870 [Stipagrostis hirtigluma subsp. patula]
MAATSRSPPPPPPLAPWVILGRVALVPYAAAGDPDPEDPSVELAAPPLVSSLTVPLRVHPKPTYRDADRHPYILAANDAGLLLHVSEGPFIGFDFGRNPMGVLVVARDFLPADPAAGRDAPTATAVRVPDRACPPQVRIANIKHVGFVSLPGTDEYVVAELRLLEDDDRASLLSFRSGTDVWVEREVLCPCMAGREWLRPIDDVISNDGKLWWVNLASGLLGWDPLANNQLAVLRHVHLPRVFAVDDTAPQPREHPEHHRMVRASNRKVRFVDMTRTRDAPLEETLVVVWTLSFGESGAASWRQRCVTSLAEIWANDSYRMTGMPEQVPVLALLHPANPDVVFFFLEQYLIGVDVHESRVTEFVEEPCDLVELVAGPPQPPPISWRHFLAWMLPPSLQNALDHEYSISEELDSQDDKDVAPTEASQSSAPSSGVGRQE